MPIICLMVRENHKMVREMSGKSQGILWGLMAGHPDVYSIYHKTYSQVCYALLCSGDISNSWISVHYSDVIMSTLTSQITSLMIVYSAVYSGADQRKHQSSASLAFMREIHQWPVNSPRKGPVTWKMFPFDVIMEQLTHILEGGFTGNDWTNASEIALTDVMKCFSLAALKLSKWQFLCQPVPQKLQYHQNDNISISVNNILNMYFVLSWWYHQFFIDVWCIYL